ncbi:DUF5129 domain-containing protein [Corynebacterium sp. 35RC1]|nr:DUF5129 domain-containing protein [Corynebacterium sp. 35RC1]
MNPKALEVQLSPRLLSRMPHARGLSGIFGAALVGTLGTSLGLALGAAPTAEALVAEDVRIVDPADLLTSKQEQELISTTAEVGLDPSITHTTYLVFRSTAESLNDATVNYAKANDPQLLSQDQLTFGDGQLIFSLATEDRNMGVYAGEDVASAISLNANLDSYLEAMRPGLRDGDWALGLADGARAVAGQETSAGSGDEEMSTATKWTIGGLVASGVALIIGALAAIVRKEQRTNGEKAKKEFDVISKGYGDLAQRLDQIDVRANSLRSPLVNAQLRSEWDTIRQGFLDAHAGFDKLEGLTPNSELKEFHKRREDIKSIHTRFQKVQHAEKNIDMLFAMENGDANVRARQLNRLVDDITKAHANAEKSTHQHALADLAKRGRALQRNLNDEHMLEDYARLVADYQIVLSELNKTQFKKADTTKAPGLDSENYRPGFNATSVLPFYLMLSTHNSAVAAANTSSSTNTSFSGGFSGSGGSGSF